MAFIVFSSITILSLIVPLVVAIYRDQQRKKNAEAFKCEMAERILQERSMIENLKIKINSLTARLCQFMIDAPRCAVLGVILMR